MSWREKGVWFVLEAGTYNQALVGLSRNEIADWAISLGKALARQERGINPLADDLMDERERYLAERRRTGGMGGRPHLKGHPPVTPRSPEGDGGAVPNRTDTVPNLKPETDPKKPEQPRDLKLGIETGKILGAGSGADKYERIQAVPQDRLAEFAARELRDADSTRAVFAYKRAIGTIGPEAFRSLIAQFMGELAAGECETVNKLGALFTSKFLKPAIEAKRKRGAA